MTATGLVSVQGGVAQLLRRPCLDRMARRSDVGHPPRRQVDDEERVDLAEQEIVGLDEVAGPHHRPVPRHPAEARRPLIAAVGARAASGAA